jgi:DNA polymerase zeta
MLSEILRMRVQIKRAAKESKARGFENLRRVNHSRQLSLKMIANVTYGYTAASFSGRMPCADIADAIVETGRDALMRAIDIVANNKPRWNARVVYGDT